MASLGGGAGSGGLPQPSPPLSDPAIVSHSLGGSGSLGPLTGGQQDAAQPSPVIMPPSANQVASASLLFGALHPWRNMSRTFLCCHSTPRDLHVPWLIQAPCKAHFQIDSCIALTTPSESEDRK